MFESEKKLKDVKRCLEEAGTKAYEAQQAMHEAQKAKHETDKKLSDLEMTLSQVRMERNNLEQENKILKKKLDEKWNQPDESRPTSSTPVPSIPSSTPRSSIISPGPDLNKKIKKHGVTIKPLSEQHRSRF